MEVTEKEGDVTLNLASALLGVEIPDPDEAIEEYALAKEFADNLRVAGEISGDTDEEVLFAAMGNAAGMMIKHGKFLKAMAIVEAIKDLSGVLSVLDDLPAEDEEVF